MEDFCAFCNSVTVESDYAVLIGKKTVVATMMCEDITESKGKAHCLSWVLPKCFLATLKEYHWEGTLIKRHSAWKTFPSIFTVDYPRLAPVWQVAKPLMEKLQTAMP